MRQPVEPRHAYRLLNHGPTTILSAAADGRANAMAASWVMAIDFEPPRLVFVMSDDTFTHTLITRSRECVVNIPCVRQLELCYALGTTHGHDGDKLARLGVATTPAVHVGAPFVEGCVAWLECRLRAEPAIEAAYAMYVADVVAAWACDLAFAQGRWLLADPALRTIHHQTRGEFFAQGERLVARQ